MNEDKGIIRPIFIGVATTVLATAILYYLGIQKSSYPEHEREGGSRPAQPSVSSSETPIHSTGEPEFERGKEATLRAWNEMQDIDESTQLAFTSKDFRQRANLYSKIDLTNVDPIYVDLLNRDITFYRKAEQICRDYESRGIELINSNISIEEKQAKAAQFLKEFEIETNMLKILNGDLADEDKKLARLLSEKYGTGFVDRE